MLVIRIRVVYTYMYIRIRVVYTRIRVVYTYMYVDVSDAVDTTHAVGPASVYLSWETIYNVYIHMYNVYLMYIMYVMYIFTCNVYIYMYMYMCLYISPHTRGRIYSENARRCWTSESLYFLIFFIFLFFFYIQRKRQTLLDQRESLETQARLLNVPANRSSLSTSMRY